MRTKIGEFLTGLRLKNNQRLKDMAEILDVSSAFLSAVENGKKNMPEFWINKIRQEYNLTPEEVNTMKDAILESQNTIALNIKSASSVNRELAVSFARRFNEMDEETGQMILNILKNRKDSD